MATITTHPGGPFYVWYQETYGYAPPATVDSNAARYLAWTEGVPKALAALIPYGAMGDPGQYIAGSALVAPVEVTTPSSPTPVVEPAAVQVEAGVEPVATPAPATPAPTATEAAAKTRPTQYGQPYTDQQIQVVASCLDEGQSRKASKLALGAMIYAMMGESNITDAPGGGWFQTSCNLDAYNGGSDYQAQAVGFFTGGECFHNGGAIRNDGGYGTYWQIANATEDNLVWSQSRGDSYARSGYSTDQLTAEVNYALSYFLPSLGSAPTPAPQTTIQTVDVNGIQSTVHELNWAGDFENLWKNLANTALKVSVSAQNYQKDKVNPLTTIGW